MAEQNPIAPGPCRAVGPGTTSLLPGSGLSFVSLVPPHLLHCQGDRSQGASHSVLCEALAPGTFTLGDKT